jgi:hypothetical protein
MWKVLKFLRTATEVLTVAGALLAAAVVAVETYQTLREKVKSGESLARSGRPDA